MNIFTLDISNGLRDHEVGAGEYLLLIDAPPLANVTVKPNSQFGATGIPLKSGHDVRSRKEVNKWFISADAVAGGTIKILMSDSEEPLTINTVPSDVNVSEIGSLAALGASALSAIDKIINPYNDGTLSGGAITTAGTITVIDKILTCDSFDFFADLNSGTTLMGVGILTVYLDNIPVGMAGGYHDGVGNSPHKPERFTFNGTNGKRLKLISALTSGYQFIYSLNEKTLKA